MAFFLAEHAKEESEQIGKAVYKVNFMLPSHDIYSIVFTYCLVIARRFTVVMQYLAFFKKVFCTVL